MVLPADSHDIRGRVHQAAIFLWTDNVMVNFNRATAALTVNDSLAKHVVSVEGITKTVPSHAVVELPHWIVLLLFGTSRLPQAEERIIFLVQLTVAGGISSAL
jgi:hypothetical protein